MIEPNIPSTVSARRKRKFSAGFPTIYLTELQKFSKKYHYQFTEKKEKENHVLEFKLDNSKETQFYTDSKTDNIHAVNISNDIEIYKAMFRLAFFKFEPPVYIFAPNPTEKQKMLTALEALISENKQYKEISIIDNALEFEAIEKKLAELELELKKVEEKKDDTKISKDISKNNAANKNHFLDDEILKPRPQNAQQIFTGNPEITPNFYRLEVYNDLDITTHNITPKSKKNRIFEDKNKEYQQIKSNNAKAYFKANKKINHYLGEIILDFTQSNTPQPLPSLSTKDELLALQSNTDLKLTYCASEGLYYVAPSDNTYKKTIDVKFVIHAPKAFQPIPPSQKKLDPKTTDLFKSLRFGIDGKILKNPAYHELKKLDKKLLLEYLILYAQAFDYKSDLSAKSQLAGIERLNVFIEEQKGVCRHRAIVFKALAEAFGIEARVVYNKMHAFVEIANEKGEYQAYDLSGAPIPTNSYMQNLFNSQTSANSANSSNFGNYPFSFFSSSSGSPNTSNTEQINLKGFLLNNLMQKMKQDPHPATPEEDGINAQTENSSKPKK